MTTTLTSSLKAKISAALQAFASTQGTGKPQALRHAALAFFSELGYQSDRTLPPCSVADFCTQFDAKGELNHKTALKADWQSADLLFQLTDEELSSTTSLFKDTTVAQSRAASYVFFAIQLAAKDYTRSQLAAITRRLSRVFPMPVMVLYQFGEAAQPQLSIAVINRRAHKKDADKDVLGKVTLIHHISIAAPHRGHVDIIASFAASELAKTQPINSFDALHAAWEAVFNVELLNKRFYEELANWYFWARSQVRFPADLEPDESTRNATSVIRLLTRLIFVWFLKEKNLIPNSLFDPAQLETVLKDWQPASKNSSTDLGVYYRAILQNLFFATLNQEMAQEMGSDGKPSPRQFVTNDGHLSNRTHHGVKTLYRYDECFHSQAQALALFEGIPFLNGGLFACLDIEDAANKVQYADGFTRTKGKQAHVPDALFFAQPHFVDLSADYGDKKKALAPVRGLIHILNGYKFTILESTPVEQEIALDPELLGNVFENLLASYNPETGQSARKQTGSFYTPRPIVDYMVDEALKAYLAQALNAASIQPVRPELVEGHGVQGDGLRQAQSERLSEIKAGLNTLFAYTDTPHPFNPAQTRALIAAIDACNILDPACGSGAYPMGILHKLVFILRKLDANNTQWKQRQIDKAYDIEDVQARESAVTAIQRDFDDNNLDYGRKLYLIENCIYGVDIQPIAIQIAKLRFFISLICDQKTTTDKTRNLGVRPLPNLEIKFIAANTLMPLQLPSGRSLFESTEVLGLETKLEKVRHRYFSARTRKDKLNLREQDQSLRDQIIAHLQANDFGNADAIRRVQWNPYDSHAVADFYHTATMFGPALAAGFDVIIGNPPYVRADGDADYMARRRDIVASKQYKTLWEKWDLYIPFIELGYQLLKPGGITTMIVSDAYCHAKYAQKSQTWFLQHAVVLRLDFLSDIQVFQAAVRNVIYFYQRGLTETAHLTHTPQRRLHGSEFGDVTLLPSAPQAELSYRAFFPDDAPKVDYACTTVPLSDICYISVGMVINADEKTVQSAFKTRDLLSPVQDVTHPKRFVEGKNLSPWRLAEHSWLEWGTARAPSQFRRQTFPELYDHASKLMLPKVGEIRVALDTESMICHDGIYVAVPWHQLQGVRNRSLKGVARYADEMPMQGEFALRTALETTSQGFDMLFLLGVLNSNTAKAFLRANRRNNIQLYPEDWKQLPIPVVSRAAQAPVVALVQSILEAIARQDAAAVGALHEQLHEAVAGLYAMA